MNKRKEYSKPTVKRTKIDNEISMVMMSPVVSTPYRIPLNPLKWWK
jgi:hypothetical protein